METVFYILAKAVDIYLSVASVAMLIRVIIPFFSDPDSNPIYAITVVLTEPLIIPFRVISDKLGFWQDTPIDIPLLASTVFLMLTSLFLPVI